MKVTERGINNACYGLILMGIITSPEKDAVIHGDEGMNSPARKFLLGAIAPLVFIVALPVQATPLNLNLLLPDITTNFMSTAYDATTDIFDVTYSIASTISYDGVTTANITGGSMSLSANISAGGIGDAVLNSGSFSIFGTTGSYTSGTLLTGNLTEIGYANNSSQVLEFLFNPTGGDLASFYTFGSGQGGIIFSVSGYNDDNFNSSFANSPLNGFADIAPVPVPAAAWLFGSGLLGLVGVARRRAQAM